MLWLLFCLALGSQAWADADVPSGSSSLQEAVWGYLLTEDSSQADARLQEILAREEATVPTVSAIIRGGPTYGPQATGLLPSRTVRVHGTAFQYGLYVPDSYRPTEPQPLLICLHGAGFTGDAYLQRWQPRLGERFILACPSLYDGSWWTRQAADLVLATLRDVTLRYHVDPDRIFLTGMSNGGIGVYLIGMHYATLFAGLAPMASGLDEVLLPFLANLRQTPVYLIHGAKDDVMPVELSRTIAAELARLGYPYVYREHDRTHPMAGGHFFPREELPDLVAWFLRHRRNTIPRRLTVVRDATHLLPFGWVRIDATDRIASFSDFLIDEREQAVVDRQYAKLDVELVAPNRIEVRTKRVQRYTLYLNEDLVDFAKPITVITDDHTSFQGAVRPDVETLLRTIRHRRDWSLLFPATLTLAVGASRP